MAALIFITHPEVTIDPATPVERWRLSDAGVRRMRLFAESGAVKNVASVWASGEAKAIEAAGLLAAGLGVGVKVAHELGDRCGVPLIAPLVSAARQLCPLNSFHPASKEFT